MTKELPPSRTAEQFVVRFPEGMRDKIAESAKANNRSMNAEIVSRLESSFISSGQGSLAPLTGGGSGSSSTVEALSQTVRELESLQRLGSLTYLLQRATHQADSIKSQILQAYGQLQKTIKDGAEGDARVAKAVYNRLREDASRIAAEIENIEKQISEIHFERKVTGLKELRSIQPVYASIDVKFSDAAKPAPGVSPKKPTSPPK